MNEFTPKTRLEKFLAKIAGRSEEELEPKTRLEAALDDIAENIGQGGSGSGSVQPVIVTINLTSETGGTWTGATWEELINAFNHNVAGITVNADNVDQFYWLNFKGSQDDIIIIGLIEGSAKINLLQDGTVELQG